MEVKTFFHQDTFTFSYIAYDKSSKDAVLIDPVMDYDPYSSKISYEFADELLNFIMKERLILHWIIETHIHADHITSSQYINNKFLNAKTAVSSGVLKVQDTFSHLYNLKEMKTDGSQFDRLFEDGETVDVGSLKLEFIHSPGHTPSCMCILIGDVLFSGDSLFIPDFGTGRCDFPDGSASDLYDTISKKLYTLPDSTKVYVGHDYQPGGRKLRYETSILESKRENVQLSAETKKEEFIEFRSSRDKLLKVPKLLFTSVQINIQAGLLPEPEDNRTSYLKIPILIT
ncbi:MAG: MBL fold metallo-hydrolase [Bacteriovoracaceae bacterium]|nr:MBL fold metallo-hydrolase [Bacteriovoracaceae bacterium]